MPTPKLLFVAVLALALTGCVAAPNPAVEPESTGDAEILEIVRASFTDDHDRAAIAVIADGEVRTAYVHADAATHFEIGSVTKALTGELLAEALDRGEVQLDDRLGEYLDLGDSPAASATLLQLATHSSGLPTFPDDAAWQSRVMAATEAGEDPFDESVDEVLGMTRATAVNPQPGFEYSNLGATLLGHALAAAADVEYPDLLQERIFDPLGMAGAVVPLRDGDEPATHAGAYLADTPVAATTLAAWAPAGGVHATLDDMVALANAVIDGPLSDSPALEPVVSTGESQIGYLWHIDETPQGTVTGHEGLTAGFWASLTIDRDAGVAVIVLVNNHRGASGDIGPLLALARG